MHISSKQTYLTITLLLAVFYGVVVFNTNYRNYQSDYWEHSAAITEFSKDLVSPKNPHIASDVPSARYSPYGLLQAIFMRITNYSVFTVLNIVSIVNFLLLGLGIYLFSKTYFQDETQPIYTLITMLFLWGKGYAWSSEYHFKTLIYTLSYPSTFCFGLSLIGLFFLIQYLRKQKPRYLLYLIIVSALVLISHPLYAAFFYGSAVILTFFTEGVDFRRKATALSMLPAGMILSLVWPYFSIYSVFIHSFHSFPRVLIHSFHSSLARPSGVSRHFFYDFSQMVTSLGPALVGLPVLCAYFVRRKYHFLVYSFLGFSFFFFISAFLKIPMGHRFIFFAVFFLHLAFSRLLRDWRLIPWKASKGVTKGTFLRAFPKPVLVLILVYSSVANLKLAASSNNFLHSLIPLTREVTDTHWSQGAAFYGEFDFLEHLIKDDAVVMADNKTSWVLPTFKGKVVALYHDNPLLSGNRGRKADIASFFRENASDNMRADMLQEYNVSYILVNLRFVSRDILRDLERLGRTIYENNKFVLLLVNQLQT